LVKAPLKCIARAIWRDLRKRLEEFRAMGLVTTLDVQVKDTDLPTNPHGEARVVGEDGSIPTSRWVEQKFEDILKGYTGWARNELNCKTAVHDGVRGLRHFHVLGVPEALQARWHSHVSYASRLLLILGNLFCLGLIFDSSAPGGVSDRTVNYYLEHPGHAQLSFAMGISVVLETVV
jgi:hypothetical protein